MKLSECTVTKLFDLDHTMARVLLEQFTYPWEALPHIGPFILRLGETLPADEYENPREGMWIHKSASLAPTVALRGPIIIGPGAEIRHCALLRGNILIGENAVVGNSTELKNVILSDFVQVPHYNYVGDSILGFHAHMGAGSITSNVRSDKKPVVVHAEDTDIPTGLKKFGAMLGDYVEIGCGSVLNPGSVIGRNTIVYPLSSVRSCVKADSIYKCSTEVADRLDL